jgi:hypothetical protein
MFQMMFTMPNHEETIKSLFSNNAAPNIFLCSNRYFKSWKEKKVEGN